MRTIVTEGQAIELLHIYFDFEAPVAFEDVKKKYRQKSKQLHPDAGGSEEDFKVFNSAFDNLKQLYQLGSRLFDAEPVIEETVEGEPPAPKMPRETVDGTPLSELGLGLGPTTNGRECLHCENRGYTITKEHVRGQCHKCAGRGRQPREYPCHSCGATGKFTLRKSERIVDCRVCLGTRAFKHPFQKEWCTMCNGTGRAATDRVVKIYALKCFDCKGTGETEVWNPVLPKGRLSFAGKPTVAPRDVMPSPPPPQKKGGDDGRDRMFPKDPRPLSTLLEELKLRGVGSKR